MTLRYPATRWQDGLPTGSGVVGALMYGNIQNDTILLNHDALYYPKASPETFDVSDLLPDMRRLIREGKCREAAQVMPAAYAERAGAKIGSTSTGRDPYQPFGAIQVHMSTDGPFRGYRRGVDFDTGRAWVQWTDATATYTREIFVSRKTDTVFLRIRASKKGAIDCRLSINKAPNEQIGKELTHTAALPGDVDIAASLSASQDQRTVTFRALYPTGFSFGALGQVDAPGGTITTENDSLVIAGADEVVLRTRLFLGEKADTALPRLLAELAETPAYDPAFTEHAASHSEIFNRVKLALAETGRVKEKNRTSNFQRPTSNIEAKISAIRPNDAKQDGTPTNHQPSTHLNHSTIPLPPSNEELLMAAYDGDVPTALIETMFEFGRYLLICSSRPGGWPANLQGLWNGDYAPAWNSDIHTDENIQMNYWQAMPGGLDEAALPLFDYFERHMDDFRENARHVFGCRGILVPIAMTTHGREIPCTWSNWTAAAGWIAQHFYDYYLFTGDQTFLKNRAIPWLKEVAFFYEDFLIEGDDGKLLFNPSLSPENRPTGGDSLMSINATMDVAVCREVLSNLCDACECLGSEAKGVTRWRTMLEKLPDYDINEDGAMKEWLHPDFKDNYHHRHQSHIYPVFPGLEVTEESSPDIYEACRVAVEKRLVIGLTSQTGWSMAHMANIYARLGQGDRALECLEILSRGSMGPNLFTYHNDWRQMGLSCGWGNQPPFQIDANFGITAAVLEMLVFSKPGWIKLLPALPGKWRSGRVTGIRCRGGVTVDMDWNVETRAFSATLVSQTDQTVTIKLPEWAGPATSASGADGNGTMKKSQTDWSVALTSEKPLRMTTLP